MEWGLFFNSAVGTVFLIAAVAKLATRTSLRPFLDALALPPVAARLIAILAPPAEAACGVALLAGVATWPAAAATGLSIGFAAILVVARQSGVSVGCSCFGPLDSGALSPASVIRAVLLAAACCSLLAVDLSGALGSGHLSGSYTGVMSLVLGAVAGLAFVASSALFAEMWLFGQWNAESAAIRQRMRSAGQSESAASKA